MLENSRADSPVNSNLIEQRKKEDKERSEREQQQMLARAREEVRREADKERDRERKASEERTVKLRQEEEAKRAALTEELKKVWMKFAGEFLEVCELMHYRRRRRSRS